MIYKQIEGYKFPYRISDIGVVEKQLPNGTWIALSPYVNHSSVWVRLARKVGCSRRVRIASLMRDYFMGGKRDGMRVMRKSSCITDCSLSNLTWATVKSVAKSTGGSNKRSIEKIDVDGNVVELYSSVREAAKSNFVAPMTIIRRCQNRIKNPYALTGYTFRYER